VLLEAPLEGLTAAELRARGFAVVVAHPERTLFGRDAGWRVFERELASGSGVQVNAWSVAGCYGERIRRDAMRVLARAPAAAIASDAHGPSRMPALALAAGALARAGDARANERVSEIPRRLLAAGLGGRRLSRGGSGPSVGAAAAGGVAAAAGGRRRW
jgi:tyrosine-protein phosphatase YwqE